MPQHDILLYFQILYYFYSVAVMEHIQNVRIMALSNNDSSINFVENALDL